MDWSEQCSSGEPQDNNNNTYQGSSGVLSKEQLSLLADLSYNMTNGGLVIKDCRGFKLIRPVPPTAYVNTAYVFLPGDIVVLRIAEYSDLFMVLERAIEYKHSYAPESNEGKESDPLHLWSLSTNLLHVTRDYDLLTRVLRPTNYHVRTLLSSCVNQFNTMRKQYKAIAESKTKRAKGLAVSKDLDEDWLIGHYILNPPTTPREDLTACSRDSFLEAIEKLLKERLKEEKNKKPKEPTNEKEKPTSSNKTSRHNSDVNSIFFYDALYETPVRVRQNPIIWQHFGLSGADDAADSPASTRGLFRRDDPATERPSNRNRDKLATSRDRVAAGLKPIDWDAALSYYWPTDQPLNPNPNTHPNPNTDNA